MGCQDACPFLPDVPNEEWDLEDPAGKSVEFTRSLRDVIEKIVKGLILKTKGSRKNKFTFTPHLCAFIFVRTLKASSERAPPRNSQGRISDFIGMFR